MRAIRVEEIKVLAENMKEFSAKRTTKGGPRPSHEDMAKYNEMRQALALLVQSLARDLAKDGMSVGVEFERLGLAEILKAL